MNWYIDEIQADALVGPQNPTITKGSQETFEFLFYGPSGADGGGFVLGGTEGSTLGGTDGGVLSGESDGPLSRARRVKQYFEYIGSYPNDTTIDGKPLINEYITDRAPVDSNIVKIENDIDFPALWVAITGGEDLTNNPGSIEVQLDVIILGRGSRYADRQEVFDDLATPINQQ